MEFDSGTSKPAFCVHYNVQIFNWGRLLMDPSHNMEFFRNQIAFYMRLNFYANIQITDDRHFIQSNVEKMNFWISFE